MSSSKDKGRQPHKHYKGRDAKGRLMEGHSGNPAGRPPVEHSLTDQLRHRAREVLEIQTKDGVIEMTRAEYLSRMVWDGITKGEAQLLASDGRLLTLELEGKDVMYLIKWLAGYLEPPTQRAEISHVDEAVIRLLPDGSVTQVEADE